MAGFNVTPEGDLVYHSAGFIDVSGMQVSWLDWNLGFTEWILVTSGSLWRAELGHTRCLCGRTLHSAVAAARCCLLTTPVAM